MQFPVNFSKAPTTYQIRQQKKRLSLICRFKSYFRNLYIFRIFYEIHIFYNQHKFSVHFLPFTVHWILDDRKKVTMVFPASLANLTLSVKFMQSGTIPINITFNYANKEQKTRFSQLKIIKLVTFLQNDATYTRLHKIPARLQIPQTSSKQSGARWRKFKMASMTSPKAP